MRILGILLTPFWDSVLFLHELLLCLYYTTLLKNNQYILSNYRYKINEKSLKKVLTKHKLNKKIVRDISFML
nr:MAG TPA: hypothetical protein [Bacteriophage sp.]